MYGRLTFFSKRGSRRVGLTLTEVLVALSLLTAAMAPILRALSQSHQTAAKLEHLNQSLCYAQGQLEELRAHGLSAYDAAWDQSNVSFGQGYFGILSDTGPGSDLRTVTVQAGYDENGNRRLETGEVLIELSTLIARRI